MKQSSKKVKKILFVSSMPLQYNFSANIRNLALIDGLCRNGHIVDVLTCAPNRDSEWFDISMDISCVHQYIYLGKDIASDRVKDKKLDRRKSNFIKALARRFAKLFVYSSIWDIRIVQVRKIRDYSIKNEYDIMISSSDPKSSHYFAKKIYYCNKEKIGRWIQYWGDPFSIDINNSGGSYKRIKNMEEKILAVADKIIYVSPFTLSCQKNLFMKQKDKMFFLPIPVKGKTECVKNKVNIERLKIGYYGAYYQKDRNMKPLYEAIRKTDHLLEIYGASDVKFDNLENISIRGKVPLSVVEEREEEMDILVCICNRSGTQIPGKAYHYAMTNKYVLILLDGDYAEEIKKYFEKFDRYLICENRIESIIETLKEIPEDIKYKTPCEFFNTKKIAEEFIL